MHALSIKHPSFAKVSTKGEGVMRLFCIVPRVMHRHVVSRLRGNDGVSATGMFNICCIKPTPILMSDSYDSYC